MMAGMADESVPGRDLAWLLDDLADRVRDFRRAVILSRDGLLIAASSDLTRDDADHLSAVAAAVQSLAAGAVAYEMAMLVKRARPHLAALPRFPATTIQAE